MFSVILWLSPGILKIQTMIAAYIGRVSRASGPVNLSTTLVLRSIVERSQDTVAVSFRWRLDDVEVCISTEQVKTLSRHLMFFLAPRHT